MDQQTPAQSAFIANLTQQQQAQTRKADTGLLLLSALLAAVGLATEDDQWLVGAIGAAVVAFLPLGRV